MLLERKEEERTQGTRSQTLLPRGVLPRMRRDQWKPGAPVVEPPGYPWYP